MICAASDQTKGKTIQLNCGDKIMSTQTHTTLREIAVGIVLYALKQFTALHAKKEKKK